MGVRRSTAGLWRGVALTALTTALVVSLTTAHALPAAADADLAEGALETEAVAEPRLTLAITSQPDDETYDVVAGGTVTWTYTVTNDTGAALTLPDPAGVEIMVKFDYFSDGPALVDCSGFEPWGFIDDGENTTFSVGAELPTVVQPGEVISCSISYTATGADVAYGGLWTMIAYEPDVSTYEWQFGRWMVLTTADQPATPAILGTPAVGESLSIEPGLWGPWDPPFRYVWSLDGIAIPDATAGTYTPSASDIGHALTVSLVSDSMGVTRTTDPVTVARFGDVPAGYPFATYISWLADRGISTGWVDADGSADFRPTQAVTREAMAAFLYRDIAPVGFAPPGTSAFSDVPTSYPFYAYVSWLADRGISTGWAMGDGTSQFRPTEAVSREAMAAFLYRAAGSPAFTPPAVSPFTDVPTDYPFYAQISWLAANGISTGWAMGDGTKQFRPTEAVTREAMAAFLQRADALLHP